MKKHLFLTAILFFSLFIAGCFSAKNVSRQRFMLDLEPQLATNFEAPFHTIEIRPTSIVPQFSGTTFVYRSSAMNYETDYYNAFFIPPEKQIHQAIVNYFTKTGFFDVVDNRMLHKPDYSLYSKVIALYADYRNKNNPQAVMAIQFDLVRLKQKKPKVVYRRVFTEKTPLHAKDSAALVCAWNIDLQKILHKLKLKKT